MASQNVSAIDSGAAKQAHRWTKWAVWLVAAAGCAVGLRNYRIDNDLGRWAPHLRATGPMRSYAVVGFEHEAVDGRALAEALCDLPGVAFCADRDTVKSGGDLIGVTPDEFVIGRDRTYAGIFLFRRAETSDQLFVDEIRRVLKDITGNHETCFSLGGPAVFHIALNQASQQRLPHIMLLILFLGGTLLWWVTGDFRAATAAMAAIALSQVILVGALSWFRVPMDVSLSMVPPLMMSFGFSYAAHRALRDGVIRVLVLCVATTAIGLGTFVFAAVPPIRLFAVAGVLGLATVWLAVITLVPASRRRNDVDRNQARAPNPFLHLVQRTVARRSPLVVGAACVLSLSVVFSIRYLRLETNPLHYFPSAHPLVVDAATLNERLTGMLSVQWSVKGEADPTTLISRAPGVRKIIDFTPMASDGKRHLWCLADNDALPSLMRLNESLRGWAREARVDVQWRGVGAQLGEVSTILAKVAAVSLPAMGFVAAAVVGLLYRSARLGLISLWVNLLPVGALMLIAALLDWALDLPSLMIGAIAVGLAIDDTLHIAAAWRRRSSVSLAMAECLRPCAGSSVVTAACLSCFAISAFAPIRQFGVLLAMAALFALLADLLLLPALLTMSMSGGRASKHAP